MILPAPILAATDERISKAARGYMTRTEFYASSVCPDEREALLDALEEK